MTRAFVLALVLVIAPAAPGAAEAQALGGGAMARASAPVARGDHRGGRHHRRIDPVTRWERSLERARARGNRTGRDPWSSYNSMASSGFARSHFPESRLARSRLWSGSCWARSCGDGFRGGAGVAVAQRTSAPHGRARADSGASRPAFAPPAVRSLGARQVTRGAGDAAPVAYAHRVWRD